MSKLYPTIEEQRQNTKQEPDHQHSYSVVVETKEKPNSEDGYGDVRYMNSQLPRTVRATKVMCPTCQDIKEIAV